jgi:tRNA(Ile)-lysidine synthase
MPLNTSAQLEEKFAHNFELLSCSLYYKNIGLAVSGGVDSVAMLILMHKTALHKNINLTVFTVNHNLRPEAAHEVKYVESLCYKLNIRCISLSWEHTGSFNNLSARARKVRYDLITSACRELDILTLLTAHHADDSIETFLLKSERESGVMALSSGNLYFHNNIRVLRPLFDIEKSQLIDYLQEQRVSWLEDSSNESSKYARNILRKKLAISNLDYKNGINHKFAEINIQATDLNKRLIQALGHAVKIYKYGFAVIDIRIFVSFEYEIQLRLIIFVLNIVSGNIKSCRASTIAPVIKAITRDEFSIKTMHGCVVKKVGTCLLIYREFGKNSPKQVTAGYKTVWDARFCISMRVSADNKAYITNLTLDDYREIKEKLNLEILKKLSFNHHKAILFTLPVIKVLEKLVALPHISYYEGLLSEENIDILNSPSFTSRFIHFY